jgi:hypothetical protein
MEQKKPIIITRVELGKHGIIKIDYDKSHDGMYESFRMESADKAAPEFYDAFEYLASHIQAIMSLDTVLLGRIIPKKNNGVVRRIRPHGRKAGIQSFSTNVQ